MTTQTTKDSTGKEVTTSPAATPRAPTPPALSESVVEGKRVVADPAAPTTTEPSTSKVEATEVDGEGTDTETTASSGEGDDSTSGDDDTAGAPKKNKGGFQRKIDKLTRTVHDTQRQLTTALQTIEKLTGTKAVDAQAEIDKQDPKPVRTAYDDPDKYAEDLASWSGRAGARAAIAEREAKEREAAASRAMTEAQKAYEKLVATGREKYDDWDAVAESDVQVSHAMAYAITRSKHGHDLQYYLGKHPEEADRIRELKDAADQVLEIGKLEAKVIGLERKKVSKTPDPLKPLGSGNNAGEKARSDMTMEEYARVRTPELQAERSGRAGRGRTH